MKKVSKEAIMKFLEKAKDKSAGWSEPTDMLSDLLQTKAKEIRRNGNSYLPRITELYILFVGENPDSDTADGFIEWILFPTINKKFIDWLFLGPEATWESADDLDIFSIANGWTDAESEWHPFFTVPPRKGSMLQFIEHWVGDEDDEETLQFLNFIKKEDEDLWKFLTDDNIGEDEWFDKKANTCQSKGYIWRQTL